MTTITKTEGYADKNKAMQVVEGKYSTARIMTDNVEESAMKRVQNMTNLEFLKGTKIVMMPDIHEGIGCAIGTSIAMNKNTAKIPPAFTGVDIGCGMSMYPLGKLENIDFEKFDEYVKKNISTYPRLNEQSKEFLDKLDEITIRLIVANTGSIKEEIRMKDVGLEKLVNSMGTLGNGNHFIELGKNSKDEYFIIVHSGSRFLGAQIADYYQKKAVNMHNKIDIKPIVNELKRQRKHQAIEPTVQLLKQFDKLTEYKDEECYLWGQDLKNYLNDSNLASRYAFVSRLSMINIVTKYFGIELQLSKFINSPHNFISETDEDYIIRKGACKASAGQDVIIPINMRDGIIYGKGKGNKDWNYSAPHGAGRMLSRRKAKAQLDVETFKEQMKDVYSTTVSEDTLDEAPDAYKPLQEILDNIQDTVDVIDIIKPVYNHKGIEEKKWWVKG